MHRYRVVAPYLLPLVCAAALLCVAAQNKESGSDPFTPTKLEWLATTFNASHSRERLTDEHPFSLIAFCNRPNTISLHVVTWPKTNMELVDDELAIARGLLTQLAKNYGWDDWLIIRQEKHILDDEKGGGIK